MTEFRRCPFDLYDEPLHCPVGRPCGDACNYIPKYEWDMLNLDEKQVRFGD